MRREGPQRGWVRVYNLDLLIDPEAEGEHKQRRVSAHTTVAGTSTVANGGYIRAPQKPTNHSKPSCGGSICKALSGKSGGSSASGKGRRKFWHDKIRTIYLEMADGIDGQFDDDMD
ncbi:uncharacterized protein LOC106866163 [Brachypodium distachyon]|uniref:Uncharacterized protein n=1 Tax=Brachypodium distachyon TaxID=15368 RepID=I1HNK0_BRADI|nr:uncharacterized protein LOC106866163 [Brachypodium distachyon]KQK08297.1 hypothetical protein BRADI_2g41000v3 [Brachypodium distachyon]|eukprot:XP_014754400.1 uncharacterized protein LOC106866163 [Brachypodium distachyon]